MKVAVVAHRRKSVGGGLPQLRKLLAGYGCDEPLWFEVGKGRKAGKKARRAIRMGAELLVVWGGDGTVQQCLDAAAGTEVEVAIVPAGTANLLASNLSIPRDPTRASDRIDVEFDSPIRYELDGGSRKRVTRLAVEVVPGAVTVRVPPADPKR